jgi:hypothetical protein
MFDKKFFEWSKLNEREICRDSVHHFQQFQHICIVKSLNINCKTNSKTPKTKVPNEGSGQPEVDESSCTQVLTPPAAKLLRHHHTFPPSLTTIHQPSRTYHPAPNVVVANLVATNAPNMCA